MSSPKTIYSMDAKQFNCVMDMLNKICESVSAKNAHTESTECEYGVKPCDSTVDSTVSSAKRKAKVEVGDE